MGPLVSAAQLETVEGYVRDRQGGGRARWCSAASGAEGPSVERGFFFEPTIFTDVDNSMTIAQEEIFGPVLGLGGAGLAGERRAVAGIAAHLHVHHQALADRIAPRPRPATSRHRGRGDADQK